MGKYVRILVKNKQYQFNQCNSFAFQGLMALKLMTDVNIIDCAILRGYQDCQDDYMQCHFGNFLLTYLAPYSYLLPTHFLDNV